MKNTNLTILAFLTLTFIGCMKEGPEGKKSLLNLVVEPQGVNCSSGGFKIVSGIDINKNDTLDASEIQDTKYICNGNNGNNTILNVIPESAGDICSSGGYKVISGTDLNSNKVLDVNEIQNTEYICNGNDGVANISTTLFTITPSQWVQHGNWFGVNLIVPSIKDSINDVVITNASKVTTSYAKQWFGLPMSNIIVTGDMMDYVYGKGQETIGYNYYSAPTTDIIIRIQVISPSN